MRLETPCRHAAPLLLRQGLPGNTCKEGGGRCCGPNLQAVSPPVPTQDGVDGESAQGEA